MEQFLLFPEPIERRIKEEDEKILFCDCLKEIICACAAKEKCPCERLSLLNACACVKAVIKFRHADKRRSIIAKRSFRAKYSHSKLVDYNENLYCGCQPSWSMSFPNTDKELNDHHQSTENKSCNK